MHKYQQIRWIRYIPLLFVLLELPLAFWLVPPNLIYGLRTAETLSSPEAWYQANGRSGIIGATWWSAALLVNIAADRAEWLTRGQKMWTVALAPLAACFGKALGGFLLAGS